MKKFRVICVVGKNEFFQKNLKMNQNSEQFLHQKFTILTI